MIRWVGNWLHCLVQRIMTGSARSMWQPVTSEGLQAQYGELTCCSMFFASLDDVTDCNLWRALRYTGEVAGMANSNLQSRGILLNFKTGLAVTL